MTEMLLPRIARQGAVRLISIRETTRKARIEQFELDEGFQQYRPPFRGDRGAPCGPGADGHPRHGPGRDRGVRRGVTRFMVCYAQSPY